MVVAIVGGIVVSLATSEDHSPKTAIARVASGLFCAVLFPDVLMDFLGLSPETYGNAIAGLLAMTGYSLSKIFTNINRQVLLDVVKAVRGK